MILIKSKKEWQQYQQGYDACKEKIKDEPTHYPCLIVSFTYEECNPTWLGCNTETYVKHVFVYKEHFKNYDNS